MKRYYQNRDALKTIEEPYKSALMVLEELYVVGPEGKPNLSYKHFPDYMAINCAREICEEVKGNPITYISTLSRARDLLYKQGWPRQNKFEEGFRVQFPYEAATILGAVYFVFAVERFLTNKQLDNLEKIACWTAENKPYFEEFKEQSKNYLSNHAIRDKKDNTTTIDKPNPIVLADNRGSDFVRVIKSMSLCGYFVHKDGTEVTATEIGSMLTKQFGRNTEWKSLLQKAFSRDNPLKTYDELRDKAQEYWQNRANLND